MKRLLFLLFAVPGFTNCFSQGATPVDATKNDSAGIRSIVSALTRHSAAFPVEKVYLQLDKPAYAPGDTIWYKTYTVIGPRHQPSALSGVLYVELIGPEDSVVTRKVLKLTSGIAAGDITLSALMPQGNYRLWAYTTWMRNAGPDYFYDQIVNIGIPPKQMSSPSYRRAPDIQFFPEGGSMVNGVRARIAVKATDTTGLGIDVSGTIEDNAGNIATTFTAQHLGMGVFALTPESGKRYRAVIKIPGESVYAVDLPPASATGMTMTVNNSEPDSIYVKVATNEKTFSRQKNNDFYLVAQSGGEVFYTSAGQLDGLVFTATVDKERFPSGITQFTLFTGNGQPVAERMAFIENDDTLRVKTELPRGTPIAGQKTKLTLRVKNSADKAVRGNFSVAVINEDQVAYDGQAEGTIINNLLLRSDLKGYIENPNYYFINRDNQTRSDLDVLMLTQGYRRFEWKSIINDSLPGPQWQAEKSLSIDGNIQTNKGKPIANAKVSLAALQAGLFADTTTDANGHFKFTNLDVTDSARVMLRPADKRSRNGLKISIEPVSYAPVGRKSESRDTTRTSTVTQAALKKVYDDLQAEARLQHAKQLKEVVIKGGRIKPPEVPYSDNLNGAGHADQVITSDQLSNCIFLPDCLRGRVTGVRFDKNGIPISMRAQNRINPPPMVLIVDGTVEDAIHINEIDPKDINTIEILRSGSYLVIYGSNAPGGAMVITLKKGPGTGEAYRSMQSDIVSYVFKGYYTGRSFYTPKYAPKEPDANGDYSRRGIYWNPDINSDAAGNASVEYFDGGMKGNYRIVIEGIDDDGNIGRQVLRYKVQ